MKVFKVDASMRTIQDDIEFILDFFVFIKREQMDGHYVYTMRDSREQLVENIVSADPFVVRLDSENWIDAINVHFDMNIRLINPNVDRVEITEIII